MIGQPDLIVDFPFAEPMSEVSASARKLVCFAEMSTVKLMRYPTSRENKAKWYSRADEDEFKRRRWQDVARHSAMLIQDPEEDEDEGRTKDKLIKCLGLDHLLARDIVAKSQEVVMARKQHRNAVLNVHKFQRRNEIYSPEGLAEIARASSRNERERAQRVATIMSSL